MDAEAVSARICRIWELADARRDAGEPIRRDLLSGLAYAPPAGDGEISARAWLTEHEADEVHALTISYRSLDRPEDAAARLKEKHRLLRISRLSAPPVSA